MRGRCLSRKRQVKTDDKGGERIVAKRRSNQPFVNRQMIEDVAFIEAYSPDVLVDLGMLMHLVSKRRWYEPYKGWTDVPSTWLAKNSRMGHRRIKASLDRLKAWGIIKGMSTNSQMRAHWSRKAPLYRYDLHKELATPEDSIPDPEEVMQEVLEAQQAVRKEARLDESADSKGLGDSVESQRPPVPAEPLRRPMMKFTDNDEELYGELYEFNPKTCTMVKRRAEVSEYVHSPVCQTCGRVYDRAFGAALHTEEMCTMCEIEAAWQQALKERLPKLELVTAYGTFTWVLEELERLTGKTDGREVVIDER